jgi:hypothetical protein
VWPSDQDWFQERLTDHKQQIALDTIGAAALTAVLISQGRAAGQPMFAVCGVDPYRQAFDFLVFILLPVLICRLVLLVYYYRSRARQLIQGKIHECFTLLQVLWIGAYGWWTIDQFIRLLKLHNIKCMSQTAPSLMKLTYQICLVCGGFPAMMLLCALTFLTLALPFYVFDKYRKAKLKKE